MATVIDATSEDEVSQQSAGRMSSATDAETVDVADWGLLATVLKLAHDLDVPATGTAIADALGIPARYADFIERRLQPNRGRGLLDRDRHGHWYPTPAGLAATTATLPTGPPSINASRRTHAA